MADQKNKRNLDSFVDDLGDLEKSLQHVVDSADDDATLDRLLVETDQDQDQVIADIDDIDLFVNEDNLVQHIDEVSTPELDALERIEPVLEFEHSAASMPDTHTDIDTIAESVSPVQQPPISETPESELVLFDTSALEAQCEYLQSALESLSEQQRVLARELHEKADKTSFFQSLKDIEQLRVHSDKQQRQLQAMSASVQPQTGLNLSNGLAAAALLLALLFGWQANSARSDVELLQQKLEEQQQQLTQLPSSETLAQSVREQMEALSQTTQTLSGQMADLAKTHGGSVKSTDDLGRQLGKLSSQSKQLDDAMDALQARVATLEKSKPAAVQPAKTDKVVDNKKNDKTDAAGQNWTVILAGSKHDWYAARKADEYAGKGFPVKVIRGSQKGEPWFRLMADGFKSQQEAEAFAARARKVLNLDSVTVGRN